MSSLWLPKPLSVAIIFVIFQPVSIHWKLWLFLNMWPQGETSKRKKCVQTPKLFWNRPRRRRSVDTNLSVNGPVLNSGTKLSVFFFYFSRNAYIDYCNRILIHESCETGRFLKLSANESEYNSLELLCSGKMTLVSKTQNTHQTNCMSYHFCNIRYKRGPTSILVIDHMVTRSPILALALNQTHRR